jgi:DHA1 family bicyclomycin/chloramphenicol resistance-like MFS transporter
VAAAVGEGATTVRLIHAYLAGDLATSASLVGLTCTTFFLGIALGQLLGGPLSDQRGQRIPMIVGGLICTLGAVGCALAPSIGLLIVFRVVQGFGGGVAAVVARAVVVDVTKGDLLAKVMSIMMAIGGLAPMVAPVLAGRCSPSAEHGEPSFGSWSGSGC